MIIGQTWLSRHDLAGGMKVLRSIGSKLDGNFHVARMYKNAIRKFSHATSFRSESRTESKCTSTLSTGDLSTRKNLRQPEERK